MGIFFTADHHFGHFNAIDFCGRPYKTADEMNEDYIAAWNETVADEDSVYYLGDFTLWDGDFARGIWLRLNGRVAVVPGGHDKRWLKGHKKEPMHTKSGRNIEVLPPLLTLSFNVAHRPQKIVVCHYPVASWDCKHHGAWHVHAHAHGKHRGYGKIIDSGVDAYGKHPLSLDILADIDSSNTWGAYNHSDESGNPGSGASSQKEIDFEKISKSITYPFVAI